MKSALLERDLLRLAGDHAQIDPTRQRAGRGRRQHLALAQAGEGQLGARDLACQQQQVQPVERRGGVCGRATDAAEIAHPHPAVGDLDHE